MPGIKRNVYQEGNEPATLEAGHEYYVSRSNGIVEHYIGDADGNPVLVSGGGQVLYAADMHAYDNDSNSSTIYYDALGQQHLHYFEDDTQDWDFCSIGFSNEPPDPTRVKTEVRMLASEYPPSHDISRWHGFYSEGNVENGYLGIIAYDAAGDYSIINTPQEFHLYVKVVQF